MIAEEIAADVVQRKKDEHGDAWFFLALDNLSAHVAESVKNIFADENVLLARFASNATESTQPNDAGHGRSVRCRIGNVLDKLLMIDENFE